MMSYQKKRKKNMKNCGNDFVAVPFKEDAYNKNSVMEIGYITKKHSIQSPTAEVYIREIKKYLHCSD